MAEKKAFDYRPPRPLYEPIIQNLAAAHVGVKKLEDGLKRLTPELCEAVADVTKRISERVTKPRAAVTKPQGGRPTIGGAPMSSAERVRKLRAAKKAAKP
jgi:hypothetical protein